MTSPVFSKIFCSQALPLISSQRSAVRRHCQTIALYTGRPVARSQTIVVSRWLVMPIAFTSSGWMPFSANSSCSTPKDDAHSSIASSSTQPGSG